MSWYLIVVAIVLPFGLAILFPDKAELAFTWMMRFKRYVIGPIGLVFAGLFILTFNPYLMLLGALIIAYAVWYIIYRSDYEVL